eukprot:scaffold291908_cov18-Tisochrysis_lutea.AAC.2
MKQWHLIVLESGRNSGHAHDSNKKVKEKYHYSPCRTRRGCGRTEKVYRGVHYFQLFCQGAGAWS